MDLKITLTKQQQQDLARQIIPSLTKGESNDLSYKIQKETVAKLVGDEELKDKVAKGILQHLAKYNLIELVEVLGVSKK